MQLDHFIDRDRRSPSDLIATGATYGEATASASEYLGEELRIGYSMVNSSSSSLELFGVTAEVEETKLTSQK